MADKRVHLAVAQGDGSIRSDGRRAWIVPADVRGRFQNARRLVFALLIAFWIALPLVRVGDGPAVFLDVEMRQFHLFGLVFNAQDTWLLFFLMTGVMFGLVFLTTLAGRVFCGWACPQTVFLEAIFRPIERLVGGPREHRIREAQGPMTWKRVARQVLKHALFLVAAFLVAHVFLAYFVSVSKLWTWLHGRPGEHPEAFGWALAMTGIFYGHFAFFREQFCVVMCPYGRLQSILQDENSLTIGYDAQRGEPRGKANDENAGACVDCKRCVVVCPTGIDIRNGMQMDCVACTACIDACDEIMDKLERPRGLVRYDSAVGLRGDKTRWLRPRVVFYAVMLVVGAVVALAGLSRRSGFEANLLRLNSAPFEIHGEEVSNTFEVHLVNKLPQRETFRLSGEPLQTGAAFTVSQTEVTLDPFEGRRIPIIVHFPRGKRGAFQVVVESVGAGKRLVREGKLIGPIK